MAHMVSRRLTNRPHSPEASEWDRRIMIFGHGPGTVGGGGLSMFVNAVIKANGS